MTRHDLNFKRELWKREIFIDDSQFLKALEGIKRLGFDPATVISRYRTESTNSTDLRGNIMNIY
jgi:hypothetical protein